MHIVALLAMNGLVATDSAIPCDLFGRVRLPAPDKEYCVRVCGETAEVRTGAYNVRASWTLADLVHANTVIVPGMHNPYFPQAADLWARGFEALKARVLPWEAS